MDDRAQGNLVYNYDDPRTSLAPSGCRWAVIEGGGAFPDLAGPIFITFDNLDSGESARLGLRVLPHHCNGVNVVHGGLLGTFLDTAFAQCLLAALDVDWNVPTINLVTDFLAPSVEGEWLESRIRVDHHTGRMAFLSGTVMCGDRTILRGQAIFRITRRGQ